MEVKLVSITQPSIEGIHTPEELVTYCARVSNPSNQMNTETAPRLLRYLIKHKHWSPFELVDMTVEIKTSRAIAAQILRHRSFSFQEFSQRYAEATSIEPIEYRKQGKTNRQVGDEPFEPEIGGHPATEIVPLILQRNLKLYEELIEVGVAKECARMVLPLATSTTLYMKGSLRSWIHYLDLRTAIETQKEHRDIAIQIQNIFSNNFPNITEALKNEK